MDSMKKTPTISYQLSPSTSKERFALDNRILSRDCGIALAEGKNRARRAGFGVRRYCTAFLLLSTIGYQLSAISALAQLAPTWKPREKEPLEKYDMPPMYIYRLETSMLLRHRSYIPNRLAESWIIHC